MEGSAVTGADKAACLSAALGAFENAGGKKEDFAEAVVAGARERATGTYSDCLTDESINADKAARKLACVKQAADIAKKANPNFKATEVVTEIGKRWQAASAATKKPFEDAYAKDMAKFKK